MAIRYSIDPHRGIVRTTATGTLTDDQLLRHRQELLRDGAFSAGMRELADVRGVREMKLTGDGMRAVVALERRHADLLGSYRLAFVTSKDALYGMARMYQALTDDQATEVGAFRTEAEAKAWLGLEA